MCSRPSSQSWSSTPAKKRKNTEAWATLLSKIQEKVLEGVPEAAPLVTRVLEELSDELTSSATASDVSDEDEKEDEFPKVLRKKVKLERLKKNKLNPSAATWEVLELGGYLPDVSKLIGMPSVKPDVKKFCGLTKLEINQEICSNADPTNEGHPTLVCGIFVNHIVKHINEFCSSGLGNLCKFEVFPVVHDKRENKFADYSIFRILNRITYIIIEVKLGIGATLTAAEQDNLAQLFLEAIYTFRKEGKTLANSTMLCVLTDGNTWHLITADLSHLPIQFKTVFSESTKHVTQWDSITLGTICDAFIAHVKSSGQVSS